MDDFRPVLRPSDLPGRLRFDVPRSEATQIGRRLRNGGIAAVTCLNREEASIEVPAGVTPEAIAAALRAHLTEIE